MYAQSLSVHFPSLYCSNFFGPFSTLIMGMYLYLFSLLFRFSLFLCLNGKWSAIIEHFLTCATVCVHTSVLNTLCGSQPTTSALCYTEGKCKRDNSTTPHVHPIKLSETRNRPWWDDAIGFSGKERGLFGVSVCVSTCFQITCVSLECVSANVSRKALAWGDSVSGLCWYSVCGCINLGPCSTLREHAYWKSVNIHFLPGIMGSIYVIYVNKQFDHFLPILMLNINIGISNIFLCTRES